LTLHSHAPIVCEYDEGLRLLSLLSVVLPHRDRAAAQPVE